MTRLQAMIITSSCLAVFVGTSAAQQSKDTRPDAAAIAKQILDDAVPADRRGALIKEHGSLAPELIAAMTVDLQPGKEEYRRIPSIWRVAVAAGRRNDSEQLKRLLEVSLPKKGERLRDWQAVVIGGGLISGVSLEGKWPGERFRDLLKDQPELNRRWQAALADAHSMADTENVPTGTRYDALRMTALDSWEMCGERLKGYLRNGTHAELQQGAICGLADIDRADAAEWLAAGLGHFPAANRKLAIDALLRTEARKAALRDRLEKGAADKSWLDDKQRQALEPRRKSGR